MQSPITVDDSGTPAAAADRSGAGSGSVVIEARALEKTFRIPEHQIDTVKERALHPFRRIAYRELAALRDVSFDVRDGEFFGIVGQNGSGKSTLLKVMASIYRADAGRIRMAGRPAPFIELGVGFNPDLTARENVVLNGVLMGLSKTEARRRFDAVLEFAELEDFAELRLKNYSSGMLVRLAFAVMVQADADIMLIDEVLAVGDVAFATKCIEVFHERRRAGKTVVLVSHDMGAIQSLCHRAMLMEHGRVTYIGNPEETAMRYYRLNFAGTGLGSERSGDDEKRREVPQINARKLGARLLDPGGREVASVPQGTPLRLEAQLEARRDLEQPNFLVQVMNEDSVVVFSLERSLGGGAERLASGAEVRISGTVENALVPGRYSIDCWVRLDDPGGDRAVQGLRLLDFTVEGPAAVGGVVDVSAELTVTAEPEGGDG
jgi:ABC-type polysaccharide/polyol phosphate transport system ATPase subunit